MELLRGQGGMPQAPRIQIPPNPPPPPRPAWDIPSWWEDIMPPDTLDRARVLPNQDVPANIADPDAMSGFQDFLRHRVPVERI